MRRPICISSLLVLTIALAGFTGCGGYKQVDTSQGPAPTHGGQLFAFPDEKGYFEILAEVPEGAEVRSGKSTVVVYFLGPDGKAPLEPLPGAASVSLDQPEGKKTVMLKPEPKVGDPLGAGRFASELGSHGPIASEATGELTTALGGQPVTVPFQYR